MKIDTSLVDLDSIAFDLEESIEFDENQILYLANSIAKADGLVSIPVVYKFGLDEYQLISGFFEYKAFIKAREINVNLPDRIRVFIADDESLSSIKEQIDIITSLFHKSQESYSHSSSEEFSVPLKNILTEIKNMKTYINDLGKKNTEEIIDLIDSKLPKPIPPLIAFNNIEKPNFAMIVKKNLGCIQKFRATKFMKTIQEFKKKNPDHEFQSLSEVLDILPKGCVSQAKMFEIIDNWD